MPSTNNTEPTSPATDIGPVCLVTGGAGFFGSFLTRRLLKLGYRVHCFDLQACTIEHDNVVSFIGDIRHYGDVRAACEGVSTVFHTAAIISLLGLYRPSVRNLSMDINVAGTEQMLKAAADAGVKRFIYTSTNNVSFDREIIKGDESIPHATHPLDLYTETKGIAERRVLAADGDRGGMRTGAVRPGGIWGGSQGGIMISSFIEQLAKGRFVALLGNGQAEADNTHVENLADAEILLAEKLISTPERVGGEAYYITDDEPMNAMEWFRPLTTMLGKPFPTLRLPEPLVYAVGYASEVLQYCGLPGGPLTRIGVLKSTRSHSFVIDKARRDLGYEPRYKRDQGMAEMSEHAHKLYQQMCQ